MSSLRFLGLIAFFVGLAALEIAHGLFRLDSIRDRRLKAILTTVARGHEEMARDLSSRLDVGRQHAKYLATTLPVRKLVELPASAADSFTDVRGWILPYVLSFAGIDRVRILDAGGRERFRLRRYGPISSWQIHHRRNRPHGVVFNDCGHPVGVSPVCTECGEPASGRE